jgi:hypothetical protein
MDQSKHKEKRAVNASARGAVGAIRRQLVAVAHGKYRIDLADLIEENTALPTTDHARQQLLNAIETLRLLPTPVPQITDSVAFWLSPRSA